MLTLTNTDESRDARADSLAEMEYLFREIIEHHEES